ncbi:hypothetical protein BLNAU_21681 [Blattamonas nauphoetae]|uniref:Uncharacterized protein n=1 Tax=Blattamonas nauphoetae TaxID=2049346 RepID=A0ABQ9WV36_9EUKA|nr:hypothetical protein BLNAU_24660 [Blattamonas nauphoetae]KAK2943371.1 hypothetical protein BLNAU_21681 [Blattamonas nauphoetae]
MHQNLSHIAHRPRLFGKTAKPTQNNVSQKKVIRRVSEKLHGTSEHAEKVRKKKMQTVPLPIESWESIRSMAPCPHPTLLPSLKSGKRASRRVQKNPKTGLGCLDLRTGELVACVDSERTEEGMNSVLRAT